jgi:hypothetical protein
MLHQEASCMAVGIRHDGKSRLRGPRRAVDAIVKFEVVRSLLGPPAREEGRGGECGDRAQERAALPRAARETGWTLRTARRVAEACPPNERVREKGAKATPRHRTPALPLASFGDI